MASADYGKIHRSEAIAVMTYFHIISLFEAGSGIKDVQARLGIQ